jgi:hypothetical protein
MSAMPPEAEVMRRGAGIFELRVRRFRCEGPTPPNARVNAGNQALKAPVSATRNSDEPL